MTWLLELLARNWKEALIGALFAALTISISLHHTLSVKYESDKVKWSVDFAKQEEAFKSKVALAEAETARTKSEYGQALEFANANTTKLVGEAQKNAWANFARMYGLGGTGLAALRSPSFGRMQLSNAGGMRGEVPATAAVSSETTSTEGLVGVQKSELGSFVETCAEDAGRLDNWRQWCNQIGCEAK